MRFTGNVDFVVVLLVLFCGLYSQAQSQAGSNGEGFTNPPPGFASRSDYVKSLTNDDDVLNAHRSGLISQSEAMMAHILIGNLKRHNFYGKVVDQNGLPVADAFVVGYLRIDHGMRFDDEEVKEYKTRTDTNGLFQFTGLIGARFGQKVSKEGYEIGQGAGFYIPPNKENQTSPAERGVFNMWKQRGPEPMLNYRIRAFIQCDGRSVRYNLLTGKADTNGDIIITMARDPVNIDRLKPFNWLMTIQAKDGGFEEIASLYPNEAPLSGYTPKLAIGFQTNKVRWSAEFNHSYFFKADAGKIYGRMKIRVYANFQPPPTLISIDVCANPANSRNLEYDSKKRIKTLIH